MPVKITPVTRREFLTTTATAATGLLFGIPGIAAGKEFFNGNDEVDPNYFVLLSDTHIDVDPDRENRSGDKMFEVNQLAVKRILESEGPRPAAVIINGDAANVRGLKEEYEQLLIILEPLAEAGIPVYITMGNHDDREPFFDIFPDKQSEGPVSNRHIAILETPDVYLFLLDTLDQVNQTPGILGPEQLEWLDESLKEHTDKPVIIIGHHYPWPNVDRGLMDYAKFYDVILPHRHVKAYIFGHSHRWDLRMEQDLHLVNLPANGGNPGSGQPTGYVHFRFHEDRMHLTTDAIDRNHSWHDQQGELPFRSDDGPTSIEDSEESPASSQLHQNYPNPFNPTTTIKYKVSDPGHVNLNVYNIQGRRVASLVDEIRSAGQHEVVLDAAKLGLASGTYVYRFESGGKSLSKTMSLVQ